MILVKAKKLVPHAVLPEYGSAGAACFDIFSLVNGSVPPHGVLVLDTGLEFEIPEGHAMFIFSRSGHGFKGDTRLANCVGVIDADYRGEVRVKLTNDGDHPLTIKAGQAMAQAMIQPVPNCEFVAVPELSHTERGANGFGSTDK